MAIYERLRRDLEAPEAAVPVERAEGEAGDGVWQVRADVRYGDPVAMLFTTADQIAITGIVLSTILSLGGFWRDWLLATRNEDRQSQEHIRREVMRTLRQQGLVPRSARVRRVAGPRPGAGDGLLVVVPDGIGGNVLVRMDESPTLRARAKLP
jgi:hypothetical protein